MSVLDDKTRLLHMREAAQKIITFTEGKSRQSLAQDELLQLGLVRLIEIIGEAASHLSDELKLAHRAIPWGAIVGMRNRLAHAYFAIDLDVVWDTVTLAIPDLLQQIDALLDSDFPDEDRSA